MKKAFTIAAAIGAAFAAVAAIITAVTHISNVLPNRDDKVNCDK